MGELRERVLEDLQLKGLRPNTIESYLRCIRAFVAFHRKPAQELGEEHVRAFLLHKKKQGNKNGTLHVYHAAIRFLYRTTLKRPERTVTPDEVVFRTRGDQHAVLHPHTFILRFLQHTLPPRFRKIRHYGLLSPSGIRHRFELARTALTGRPPEEAGAGSEAQVEPDEARAADELLFVEELRRCPMCKIGRLHRLPLDLVVYWLVVSQPPDTS